MTARHTTSAAPRHIYRFEASLPSFVSGRDSTDLSDYLLKSYGSTTFQLWAVPRERHWAISLPHGAFAGRFNPVGRLAAPESPLGDLTPEDETKAFQAVYEAAQKAKPRIRDPLANRGWMIEREGIRLFRKEGIDYLAFHAPHSPLFHALSAFLTFVERRETVRDPKGGFKHTYPNRKFIRPYGDGHKDIPPAAERPVDAAGRTSRGPNWSAHEDALVRRFFGRDSEGKRIKMTEEFWALLLGEPTKGGLQGMRTRDAVRARVVVLNAQLKKKLMIDGLISRENVIRYQRECLGERACLPRRRPRLDGTYDGVMRYDEKHGKPILKLPAKPPKQAKPAIDLGPIASLVELAGLDW